MVADVENGNRLETYVLEAPAGSGMMQMNGAAAHLVNVGDRIIVFAYALVQLPLTEPWTPKVALLDERNAFAGWLGSDAVEVS